MYDDDEEEYTGEGSGIYPDLLEHLDLFNRVSKITIDCETEITVLSIKLEDGTWSFYCFYDVGNSELNREEHEKLLKSLNYYLGEMA